MSVGDVVELVTAKSGQVSGKSQSQMSLQAHIPDYHQTDGSTKFDNIQ